MNLIKTEIVDPAYDILWGDIGEIINDSIPKPVLVLVTGCESGSTEEAQLQKMLGACQLKAEQYNVIRIHEGQMAAWHKLRELLNPQIIFLIGVTPSQLGISALFGLNAPNNFDGRIWLATLSLNELEKQPEAKKQLWSNGMKPIFVDRPLPSSSNE